MEYAAKRKELKQSVATITSELQSLREQVRTEDDIGVQKQIILKAAEQAKASGFLGDVPFDIQQRIIKTVIDRIIVNPREGWFRIEGAINGDWDLSQTCKIVQSPAGK